MQFEITAPNWMKPPLNYGDSAFEPTGDSHRHSDPLTDGFVFHGATMRRTFSGETCSGPGCRADTKVWLVQLSSSPSSAAAIDSLACAMN
jgi:hypothetical protein